MRTHRAIIKEIGAPKIASAANVDPNTVHGWKRGDNIPGAYWRSIVLAGHSSYEELASAAQRRARSVTGEAGASA